MKDNREKLIKQLFAGKVAEILGFEKTTQLLKEATEVFPFEPVPLTKERALQYGFYPENNVAEKWYSSNFERRCLRIMFNDHGYWLILWDKEEGVNLGRVYQYEHELQNVWQSITGEQLTAK